MLHRHHYQASYISANQAETHLNRNLILYRHFHQPQMELEQDSTTTTASRVDIHQPRVVQNFKHMVHPHRLRSSNRMSTLPSPLITSNDHLEEKDYNMIEDYGKVGKSRNASKNIKEQSVAPPSKFDKVI